MSSNQNSETSTNGDTSNATRERNQRRKAKKKADRAKASGYKKKVSNYAGATEEMNKHVYQCTTETDNRNQYTRTTEELLQYINKHISKNKQDILYAIKNLEETVIAEPDNPPEDASTTDIYRWKAKIDRHLQREDDYKSNLGTVYSVIYGQCSDQMKAELKTSQRFKVIDKDQLDCISLLGEIRAVAYEFESKKNIYVTMDDAVRNFSNIHQHKNESLTEFKDRFDATIKALEYHGHDLGRNLNLIEHELKALEIDHHFVQENRVKTNEEMQWLEDAKESASEKMKAAAFLHRVDKHRYGQLIAELENSYTRGNDEYPQDLVGAFNILSRYKRPVFVKRKQNVTTLPPSGDHDTPQEDTDVSFYQEAANTSRTLQYDELDELDFCFTITDDHKDELDTLALETAPSVRTNMQENWILLDCQSTCDVFSNRRLLKNVHTIPENVQPLYCRSNGGTQISDQQGTIPGFGKVWYNPNSLANILSLASVRKICRVTMDTAVENAILVHKKDGSIMKFTASEKGLYYFQVDHKLKNKTSVENYSFLVQTVDGNRANFTRRELEGAEYARKLYALTNRPSRANFTSIVRRNLLQNCPVTVEDVNRMYYIHGEDVAVLKGKTTKRQPLHVPDFVPTPLPPDILTLHQDVTLCADIFFVHGLAFMHTISRKIQFRTVQYLPNRKINTILSALQLAMNLYPPRGFNITSIHTDNEMKPLRDKLLPVQLNVCCANEHVPEIERSIQTVKERIRVCLHDLPFSTYPKVLTKEVILNSNSWLNAFPSENGISKDVSPREIITGKPTDFKTDCRVEFGTYCQIHENNNITNKDHPRSIDAIALGPTGNRQGTYNFLTLDTWEKVGRNHWTELPMPRQIIEIVNNKGKAEGQKPVPRHNNFNFEWRPSIPFETEHEDKNDETINNENMNSNQESTNTGINNNNNQTTLIDDEINNNDTNVNDDIDNDDDEDMDDLPTYQRNDAMTCEELDDQLETDHTTTFLSTEEEEEYATKDNIEVIDLTDDDDDIVNNDDITIPTEVKEEGAQVTIKEEGAQPTTEEIGANDTVAGDKRIPKLEPEEAIKPTTYKDAVTSIPTSPTSTPRSPSVPILRSPRATTPGRTPKHKQNKGQLRAASHRYELRSNPNPSQKARDVKESDVHYMFLQLEEHPTLRNRMCVHKWLTDFIFTQMHYTKGVKKHGEAAIAAIIKEVQQLDDLKVLDPIMAAALTPEERKRALNAITLIKEKRTGTLKGRTCADGRKQREYVKREDAASPALSTEGLYMTLAIDAKEERDVATADVAGAYLKADMNDLVHLRFTGNMVDYVVAANRTRYEKYVCYEGKTKVLYTRLTKALYGCIQSALLWYNVFSGFLVKQGFKINPLDNCVANKMIDGKQCTICWYVDDLKISHVNHKVVTTIIKIIEARFGKMNVVRGKHHVYIGVDIKFTNDKKVQLHCKDHLKECINDFKEEIKTSASTPASRWLFTVSDDAKYLEKDRKENYHSIVMKLLWISKRARFDIQLALSFLCTRTNNPDEDDWKKLRRLLQYIYGTIDMVLTLAAEELDVLRTWVDASYAVHPDMRSHTGSCISLGLGLVYSKSGKQTINAKSSTEGEVIGISDRLPQTIWAKYFLNEQGYNLNKNILYEDNQSAMRIAKNGVRSCGQNSRHYLIRYYFIKDRLAKDNIEIQYCPTQQMLADFFTKPLQGSLFKLLRDVIMGILPLSALNNTDSTSSLSKERVELLNNIDDGARVTSAEKVEETVRKDNSRGVTWKLEEHASVNNRFNALLEDDAEAL